MVPVLSGAIRSAVGKLRGQEESRQWNSHSQAGAAVPTSRYERLKAGGGVNYNDFDAEGKRVTFDIIVGERENLGRGYGSDALRTLVRYLFATFSTLEVAVIGAHPVNAPIRRTRAPSAPTRRRVSGARRST